MNWLKKIGGYLTFALLFAVALFVFLWLLRSKEKELDAVRKEKERIEASRRRELDEAVEKERWELERLEARYTKRREELDAHERELAEFFDKGASGIAEAWNRRIWREKK